VESADLPEGVSRDRTSHTGGHRFAPTFVVLPEGTSWAYADLDLVERVLWRRGEAADVADRYRGCTGLSGPHVQAVEREVLRQVGWELLDMGRYGRVVSEGSDGGVAVRFEVPGLESAWEATVLAGRVLSVPDCMKPIGEAKKTETEWRVAEFRQL
jgi:hypothetical protein